MKQKCIRKCINIYIHIFQIRIGENSTLKFNYMIVLNIEFNFIRLLFHFQGFENQYCYSNEESSNQLG